MNLHRVALSAAGVLLLIAAAAWWSQISHWLPRLPEGWSWELRYVGVMSYADANGRYPDALESVVYDRRADVHQVPGHPDLTRAEDRNVIRDAVTGAVTWEYIYRADVDRLSGRHAGALHRDDFWVFPRNVDPGSEYRWRQGYVEGLPLRFEAEETVAGVRTFVFAYEGAAEYTASYAGSDAYEGVAVEPGQEIRCSNDEFWFRVWVEPLTGEIVRLSEGCMTGDSIYDRATRQIVAPVARWNGLSIESDALLHWIRGERRRVLLWTVWIPGILAAIGVGALGLAVFAGRRE